MLAIHAVGATCRLPFLCSVRIFHQKLHKTLQNTHEKQLASAHTGKTSECQSYDLYKVLPPQCYTILWTCCAAGATHMPDLCAKTRDFKIVCCNVCRLSFEQLYIQRCLKMLLEAIVLGRLASRLGTNFLASSAVPGSRLMIVHLSKGLTFASSMVLHACSFLSLCSLSACFIDSRCNTMYHSLFAWTANSCAHTEGARQLQESGLCEATSEI